jgi:hypothetical protein
MLRAAVVVATSATGMVGAFDRAGYGIQRSSHRHSEQRERDSNLRGAVLHDAGFSVGGLTRFRKL